MEQFPMFGPFVVLLLAAVFALASNLKPVLQSVARSGSRPIKRAKSVKSQAASSLVSAFLDCDYRESTEAVTGGAVQNIEFNKGVPKSAFDWFGYIAVGANNSIGGTGIDRYLASVDSDQWLDVTPSELRALFDFVYSRYGGQIPATNDLTWGVPFDLFGFLAPQLGAPGRLPVVGLPSGLDKTFLIRGNANLSAGSFQLNWKLAASEPTHMPYMVGKVISGLTVSTADQEFELNLQKHPVVGFIMDWGATEFTRLKICPADDGGNTTEATDLLNATVLSLLQPYNNAGITDPVFIPLTRPVVFKKNSVLKLSTGAGYDGTQRIVPVMLVQIKRDTTPTNAAA